LDPIDITCLISSYLPILPDGKGVVTSASLITKICSVELDTEELANSAREMSGIIQQAISEISESKMGEVSGPSSSNTAMSMYA